MIRQRTDQFVFALLALLFAGCVGIGQADTPQGSASEQDPPARMDNDRLDRLIRRLDDQTEGRLGFWRLTVEGHPLTVITDASADRMRIMMPVVAGDSLDEKRLYRLMQANFDSALDARYAVANDVLWSVFIHPLGSLGDREFLAGIGQVINLGKTYGTTYSSGALIFGGGDSRELQHRELIDRLIQKGLAL